MDRECSELNLELADLRSKPKFEGPLLTLPSVLRSMFIQHFAPQHGRGSIGNARLARSTTQRHGQLEIKTRIHGDMRFGALPCNWIVLHSQHLQNRHTNTPIDYTMSQRRSTQQWSAKVVPLCQVASAAAGLRTKSVFEWRKMRKLEDGKLDEANAFENIVCISLCAFYP